MFEVLQLESFNDSPYLRICCCLLLG